VETQIEKTETQHFEYAGLLIRVKASLIDLLILVIWIIAVPSLVKDNNSTLRIFLIFFPVILYEPLMITFFGFTIGQKLFGIKILNEKDLSKCPLHLSVLRTVVKYLLGSFSMIYIFFSDKLKAIHDYAAGTIAILDPLRHKKRIIPDEADDVNNQFNPGISEIREYIYPSGLRRFIVFILWYFTTYFILAFILSIIISLFFNIDLTDEKNLPKYLNLIYYALSVSLLITTLTLAIKGLLPGALRRKNVIKEIQ
jgi:uncharacterized RDD family membrane protein YckC